MDYAIPANIETIDLCEPNTYIDINELSYGYSSFYVITEEGKFYLLIEKLQFTSFIKRWDFVDKKPWCYLDVEMDAIRSVVNETHLDAKLVDNLRKCQRH